MAQEHLNSLLTEAGMEQADIDAVLALQNPASDAKPEDIEAAKKALEPFIGKINTSTQTKVKNDPKFWETLDDTNVNEAFKKKIEGQQYGRAANIMREKLMKGLGFTDAEIADISEDDKKKPEVFTQKLAEKFATSKVGDKEMQKQLIEARKKYEELETELPTREEKIKTDLETRFTNEKMDFIILAELATIPGLKAPAQYLIGKIAAELKAENAFAIDGVSAKVMQKDKPALELLDGSKAVTLKDLIIKKLKADDLIGDVKADDKKQQGKVEILPDDKGGLAMSSHIADKIKASMEAEK